MVRGITPFSPEEARRYMGDAEVSALACAEVDAIRSGTVRTLVGMDAPEEFRRKAAFAASVQGLAPRLAALPDLDLLPPDLRLHLEGEAGRCAARGERILHLLDRVGPALTAEGIRALPLKGSALLLRGEIPAGLRPMADLDLLLDSEADVRRAAGLLTVGLGYRVLWNTARHLVLAEEHEAVSLWACEHPGNPLRIELHRSFRLDLLGTVLDATSELRIATEKIGGWEVPTREALAHHLLFHAAEDFAAKGLRGVQAVDFLVLARRHGLLAIPDVPKAGRAPLLYAVDAVERLFPGSFDHEGVGRLAAKVPAALRARAAAIPVLRHSRPERGWTATSLSLVDGAAPKVRFLIRTLFPRLDEVKANVAPGADGPALWAAWAKVLARRLSSGVRRLIGR